MKISSKVITILLLFLFVSSISFAQKKTGSSKANIPTGKVIDQEKLLSDNQIDDLETKMKRFSFIFKAPMAIFITTPPRAVDPNKKWTVEYSRNPKGVMIMLSATNKETSLGLGPEISKRISNQKADQLMEEIALSYFQNGEYHAGLQKVIQELTDFLD